MERSSAEPRVDELPGPNAQEWVEYHHRFAAPSTYVREFVWDVTEDAVGPFCTDVDGNVLMDFATHVAAAPLGYNNPHLAERLSEFDLVDPLKIAGQDFYAGAGSSPGDSAFPGPAHLMDRLTTLTDHYGMDTVFLSNSGAEAVENAMKICYDYRDSAKYAITFEGAFHGRTLGTLSLNRSKALYRREFPELAGVAEFEYSPDGVDRLARNLRSEYGFLDPAEVAFIVVEPIQGEGGYRIPSEEFMSGLEDIRSTHGIPVIADEIQSGLSRTGERWGVDHYALSPDVITSAKALRVGATVSDSDVFPSTTGRLSSTWGAGDVIASAVGALTIDVIEDRDLRGNATRRGAQFEEQLRDEDLPGVVDVRGRGLMLAVEVESAERRDAVLEEAFEEGLVLLGCGERTIRVLPPLDVREREIDIAVDRFARAIRTVAPATG
jgi:4-aminobutyrate aminotransferase